MVVKFVCLFAGPACSQVVFSGYCASNKIVILSLCFWGVVTKYSKDCQCCNAAVAATRYQGI